MLNSCSFIGNLGKEPEVKESKSGLKFANFSLAVTEKVKDKNTGSWEPVTTWVNFTAFGNVVGVIEQYIKKGSKVYIDAKYNVSEYEKDGEKKKTHKFIVQKLIMLGGNNSQRKTQQQASNEAQKPNSLDDDIPF